MRHDTTIRITQNTQIQAAPRSLDKEKDSGQVWLRSGDDFFNSITIFCPNDDIAEELAKFLDEKVRTWKD